jgi:predicted nucleic acid-binding protein
MELPTCILSSGKDLVTDASVLINVAASGHGERLLRAIPNRIIAPSAVISELEHGRARGRATADLIRKLRSSDVIAVRELGVAALGIFEALVVGPATDTLDDGEAATIALAVEISGMALIDEKKGNRLGALRYPDLTLGCSVDLFSHPAVAAELGAERLADAVANALTNARMRVLDRHLQWVRDLIGAERAATCTSLPRKAR